MDGREEEGGGADASASARWSGDTPGDRDGDGSRAGPASKRGCGYVGGWCGGCGGGAGAGAAPAGFRWWHGGLQLWVLRTWGNVMGPTHPSSVVSSWLPAPAIPALHTSTSSRPLPLASNPAANARIDARDARFSTAGTATPPPPPLPPSPRPISVLIRSAARAALLSDRHATTTRKPPSASRLAVSYPTPVLAPVTIAVWPAHAAAAGRYGTGRANAITAATAAAAIAIDPFRPAIIPFLGGVSSK